MGQTNIHLNETLEKLYRESPTHPSINIIESKITELSNIRNNIISKYGKLTEQEMGLKENCNRCDEDIKNLYKTKNINTSSFLNRDKDNFEIKSEGDIMVDNKTFGMIAAGDVAGKITSVLADYVDTTTGKQAATFWAKPSTYINLGVGVGGALLVLFGKRWVKSEELQLMLASASAHILSEKTIDYAMSFMQPTVGRAMSVRAPIRITPTRAISPISPLVVVD